jgi:DNA repair photolyase
MSGRAGERENGRIGTGAVGHALAAWPPDRLTASPWPLLDERRRGTRFVHLAVKSVLNTPATTGMDFWSVNPYVGCEFGCAYCYARFAHQYVVERARDRGELSAEAFADWRGLEGWEAFERRIFVKTGAAEVLALTLRPARLRGRAVVIGTATDPYQPAERTFRLTRRVLERLAQFHGLRIGLITKSPLVARDVDVLRRLAERSHLSVHISMIAVDAPLVRLLEPRSPVPAVRLRALAQLVGAGINAGVMLAPVVPGITDDVPHLEALMRAAGDAGARFVRADPLRLYPAIKRRFLPLVAEHFPALLPKYERAFDGRGIVRKDYVAALKRRVARLRREAGLSDGREDTDTRSYEGTVLWGSVVQQELALGMTASAQTD